MDGWGGGDGRGWGSAWVFDPPFFMQRAIERYVRIAVGEELLALVGGEVAEKLVLAERLLGYITRSVMATLGSDYISPEKKAVAGVVVADYTAVEPGEAVSKDR
jgi:hypothetical protein